jgi:hypothetical protein
MQKFIHEIRDFTSFMQIHIYINELCLKKKSKNFFRQVQQYTVLTLRMGTIFKEQLPTFYVFRKVNTMQFTIKSPKSYE